MWSLKTAFGRRAVPRRVFFFWSYVRPFLVDEKITNRRRRVVKKRPETQDAYPRYPRSTPSTPRRLGADPGTQTTSEASLSAVPTSCAAVSYRPKTKRLDFSVF